MAKYGFKHFRQRFLDVPRWIGIHSISRTYLYIKTITRALLVQKKPTELKETFEEVVTRLELSEFDLIQMKQRHRKMSRVYACIFWVGLAYWFYLIFHLYWLAVVMMTSFQFLIFSFYFRESFWLTQLKKKKLGLTFKDWMKELIKE